VCHAQFLYKALERVIPDVRQRVKTELIGTLIHGFKAL
jgi:hypothetical protein